MNKKNKNNMVGRILIVGMVLLLCWIFKVNVYAENDNGVSFAEIAEGTYRVINLPMGKTISGALTQDENEPKYYKGILYKFTLTKSGRVDFSTYTESPGIRYNILDKDGEEIYSGCRGTMYYNDKLGMGRDKFYFHLSKGTYYLEIITGEGYNSEYPQKSFKIKTKFTDANVNEGEPNDDFKNATLLGKEGKIRGQFSISDTKDIYKIKVDKKTILKLVYKSEEAMPYGIEVFDKSGNNIYKDGYVYIENVKHEITLSPGTNYIMVYSTSYWNRTHEMGNYRIDYSIRQTLSSKNVTLQSSAVSYTGKVRNAVVIVRDNSGKRLVKGTDYAVYIPSGRRNVGSYTYKIVFKGYYKGTGSKVFKIVPAKTKLTNISKTRFGIKLAWSKSKNASGYLVYRSTDGGAYKKIKNITSYKVGTYTDSSATSRWTKYSYKIYVYKKVKGKAYVSYASAPKAVYIR